MIDLSKRQWLSILSVTVLFAILYFGCDTKAKDLELAEKSRADKIETTGFQTLINKAKPELNKADRDLLDAYNVELNNQSTDEGSIGVLKKIASHWYSLGNHALSGHYAEEIAKLNETPESWSISGTTYALGIKSTDDTKLKQYCQGRAVKSFDKAIWLDPENVDHKINLAICYVDLPPQDNPMKGIQMLLGLNRDNPENVSVINQLARLGMRTNQFEKAKNRLEKAIQIEPENRASVCMLAEVYTQLGQAKLAAEMGKKCNELNNI